MRYSLSNLLLLTALIAVLMGWFYDHRRLSNDKERLNLEAAEYCTIISIRLGSAAIPVPPGETLDKRSYQFSIEGDRRKILERIGIFSKN
jgi:hypothetical protein